MRKILTCAMLAAMAAGAQAQITNMAISNADGSGRAEAFTITELDGATGATFQMWLKPTAWTAATLIGQDNFSVETTADGKVTVSAGDKTATITSDALQTGKWAQLTVTVDNGTVSAYVNNTAATVSGDLPATFAATASAFDAADCVIAQGFKGSMDEIRVWSRALEQEDFFWQNTLNKFNDNLDALAAYWKCDQQGIANGLYDYRHGNTGLHHNASLTGITKVQVTDNDLFKYRVVAGYTNLQRFTDRPNINRDMFLMTNDVILLSGKVQEDGSVVPEWPDNSATPTNVDYLAEWQGRTGVMDFKGVGAQMVAANANVPFCTTHATGNGESPTGSFETWLYIDEWNEGAEVYSNYIDDDRCVSISLGSEADKEIVVNMCGTIGTLKNIIKTGEWQYLGVYLRPAIGALNGRYTNPIHIGVGEYDENGEFQSQLYHKLSSPSVALSGNDVTISALPKFEGGTLTIGKNFDGKMDEFMIWGDGDGAGDRSTRMATDATTEYQWNMGVWNNIFLCAYYKGDDPNNVGKDSQSLYAIADYLRDNYYTNREGYKIRVGLISGLPNEGWHDVLDKEENVDNFINGAKEIIKHVDGLDVDLEWMNNQEQWNMYNHIVSRLINEVMADYPDKTFSCSLHGWNWNGFNLEMLGDVDYFTMQIYDWPDLGWDLYMTAYNRFHEYGYPDEQLLLSYATIQRYAGEGGYKDLFEMGFEDEYDPDIDEWTDASGTTHYFNGVNMVKRKQQFIIDEDLRGTMYFDMGNDLRVDDYRSLIRAQNEVIASNVDTVITEIDMKPSGVRNIIAAKRAEMFTAVQDGDNITVTLADGEIPATLSVYAVDGRAVMTRPLTAKRTTVEADGMERGVYLLRVTRDGDEHTVKIMMR